MPRLQDAPGQYRRRVGFLATSGAVLAAICATAMLLVSHSPYPAKVIANDLSGRPTACLATDSQTASKDADVAQTWAAMLNGVKGLGINVQRLILPAKTPSQARPYLAGLIQQHCTLVVTVGTPFGQAIPADQKLAPQTQFIAIAGGTLPANDTLRSSTSSDTPLVQNEVRSLARPPKAQA